jgi:hypothetical protein
MNNQEWFKNYQKEQRATLKKLEPKKTPAELLQAVHNHAVQNYTVDGWDYWVEAYEDSDRLDVIKGARTVKGAIKKALADCKIIHDHENEVRATEW